jgi:cytochrome P450
MQRDPITFLSRLAREYGDVVHFTFGPQHLYFFNHPDAIREVLVTQARSFQKGRALQRAKVILGEGLLTSEADIHRRQRRLAQPAFHHGRIARYAEVMVDRALRTRHRWRGGEVVDIHQEMMRLTRSGSTGPSTRSSASGARRAGIAAICCRCSCWRRTRKAPAA